MFLMLSTKLFNSLNKAELMFLYYICNTATEKLGYQSDFEFIKILRPHIVSVRLEELKKTVQPKCIPILTKLQKKLSAEI